MIALFLYLSLSAYYWDFSWLFTQYSLWEPLARGAFVPYFGALLLVDYVLGKWFYNNYILEAPKTTRKR